MSTTVIEEPWNPTENKKYKVYKPSKLGVYNFSGGFSKEGKVTTTNKIIDNKQGEEVYKDTNLEIYVGVEETIRDFIYCFSLDTGYSPTLFFKFLKYDSFLPYPSASAYDGGHYYNVGDIVTVTLTQSHLSYNYMCIESHIADLNWYYEDKSKWIQFDTNLINISKQILASNYTEDFPYVGELVFKNIWGCDVSKRLRTYVKGASNLLIYYANILSKNLRVSALHYTKFFDRGIAKEGMDYGCRLNFGPTFDADEILGNTVLNNYFNITEETAVANGEALPANWSSASDNNLITYFGGASLTSPYDHYYLTRINDGIPFFKNKEFNDAYIRIFLEKQDKLGNIFQRIMNLPIRIVFYNNLIKVFKPLIVKGQLDPNENIFIKEYKNATNITYDSIQKLSSTIQNITYYVWCPDCEKLMLSSTVLGVTPYVSGNDDRKPHLEDKNGQICKLTWGFDLDTVSVGDKIYVTHKLQYNDGMNYDEFIFFEELTITA